MVPLLPGNVGVALAKDAEPLVAVPHQIGEGIVRRGVPDLPHLDQFGPWLRRRGESDRKESSLANRKNRLGIHARGV